MAGFCNANGESVDQVKIKTATENGIKGNTSTVQLVVQLGVTRLKWRELRQLPVNRLVVNRLEVNQLEV